MPVDTLKLSHLRSNYCRSQTIVNPRVTTKTFSAVFSAENNCLILEILGLGKNSRFRQQYLEFCNFLILQIQNLAFGKSQLLEKSECTTLVTLGMCNLVKYLIYVSTQFILGKKTRF